MVEKSDIPIGRATDKAQYVTEVPLCKHKLPSVRNHNCVLRQSKTTRKA